MTPHNRASSQDIAPIVLLPGDPARAEWVAHQFLEGARQVTDVRGMLGFTGVWKGRPVSVMASGMGGPSAGIYSYELFHFYPVERIIRIGTSGGLQSDIAVGDVVIAMTASTDSAWAHQYQLKGTLSPAASFDLFEKAVKTARTLGIPFHAGMVFSSDLFSSYNALGPDSWQPWARLGALAQDMETYALYCTAAYLHKEALSLVTMTDSCVTGKSLADDQRMSALEPMIRIALELA
jgi:purine-nucleoside phosphorylase